MFEKKNMWQFAKNFTELERLIDMGYVDPSVMFKVDVFARSTLQGSAFSLLTTFNNPAPFLDTPKELYIASNNTADQMSVMIRYIDQNRNMNERTVTLNGTTPISLGTDIYCIWRMYNTSNIDHKGTITVTSNATGVPASDSEVYCNIVITVSYPNNQSVACIFSIPAGYSGFITRALIQAARTYESKGFIFIRPSGGVFRFVKGLSAYQGESIHTDLFQRLPEKTDIKPLGYSSAAGAITLTEYTIVCINNEYLDKHLK